MRSSEVLTLPVALKEYEVGNEQVTRTTIQQAHSVMHSDIRANRDGDHAPAALAFRRQQFLLMGS